MKIEERNLEFVYLHRRRWVEAEMYPYLTLLGQSLGSIWLGKKHSFLLKICFLRLLLSQATKEKFIKLLLGSIKYMSLYTTQNLPQIAALKN